MIKASSVERFLSRRLRSLEWVKEVPSLDLDARILSLRGAKPSNLQLSKMYRHQREMLLLGCTYDQVAFFADMGLGKQQPVSEPVLTPKGWVTMGDLRVGDSVVGVFGPVRVVGVFPQGVSDVYKVMLDDGSWTRAGSDHLWFVEVHGGGLDAGWMTMTTSEIAEARVWPYPSMSFCVPRAKVDVTDGVHSVVETTKHRIVDIIRVGDEDSRCIAVDAGDGLYVTRDNIVTHNTLSVLHVVRNQIGRRRIRRALTLVPNVANIANWEQEGKRWVKDLRIVGLYGSSKKRLARIEQAVENNEWGLFVLNYQGLVALCKSGCEAKVPLNPERVELLSKISHGLVFDESQALRSWKSKTYKLALALAERSVVRYALTGTPVGRDPHVLWPQMRVIDGGASLGYTLGMFRAAYFNQRPGRFTKYDYTLKPKAKEGIARALEHSSVRYKLESCVNLPEQVFTDIPVPLPKESGDYYNSVLRDLKSALGDHHAVERCFVRMRQIPSGWIGLQDEIGRVELDFPDNPKLDTLMSTLESVPLDKKVVIFHEFIHSGELITRALKKEGYKYVWLWGGQKDKIGTINKFKTNKSIRILVANTASGGTGLNLQVANYVICFELPVDPIVYEQALKRCHRVGQTNTVFYYRLLCAGTVETRITEFLAEGKSMLKALIDNRVTL